MTKQSRILNKILTHVEEFYHLLEAFEADRDTFVGKVIDPEELEKMAHMVAWECGKKKCKKCSAEQQIECWDQYEAEFERKKDRNRVADKIPYSEEQLKALSRHDLAVLTGILGINVFRLPDKTDYGLRIAILEKQKEKTKAEKKGGTKRKDSSGPRVVHNPLKKKKVIKKKVIKKKGGENK